MKGVGGMAAALVTLGIVGIGLSGDSPEPEPVGPGNPEDPGDIIRAFIIDLATKERAAPNPQKYWRETLLNAGPYPPHWCGAFALWAIKAAGLAPGVLWKIGTGFLYRLPRTASPKPGDVAYFEKNQHHALVAAVKPGGDRVVTIDGNDVGGSIGVHERSIKDATAYYSIEPWIKEMIG